MNTAVKPSIDQATDNQYQIAAARRQHYDNLLWQTPVISLTAQAFLFTIALGSSEIFERSIACILALITALASLHLLAKHRIFELHYSSIMEKIETHKGWPNIGNQASISSGVMAWSAYRVWVFVFACFAAASILAFLKANKFIG